MAYGHFWLSAWLISNIIQKKYIFFIPFSNLGKSLAFFPPDGSATASHLSISIDVAGACVLSCTGKHMFANKHMLAVFVPKKRKEQHLRVCDPPEQRALGQNQTRA